MLMTLQPISALLSAILIKRTGYLVPIGQRVYDHRQIDQVVLEKEQGKGVVKT